MPTITLDPEAAPFTNPDPAAKFLGIDRKTLLVAIRDKQIPHTRVGRRILIPTAWLVAQAQATGSDADA